MNNEIPEVREVGFVAEPDSPWPKTLRIESKSKPGEFHIVTVHDEGGFATCDSQCKGFSYRATCRHVKEARQLIFGLEATVKMDVLVAALVEASIEQGETRDADDIQRLASSKEETGKIIKELWG